MEVRPVQMVLHPQQVRAVVAVVQEIKMVQEHQETEAVVRADQDK